MKKIFYYLLACVFCFGFISCATTPITNVSYEPAYSIDGRQTSAKNAFIGFKTDIANLSNVAEDDMPSEYQGALNLIQTSDFSDFGSSLQSANISKNLQKEYFGSYESYDFDNFNVSERYISYVEVAKHKITYDDNHVSKNVMTGISGGLLGEGLVCLLVGGIYNGIANNIKEEDYYDSIDYDAAKKSAKLVSNVYFGVGGVSAGIGLIGLLVNSQRQVETNLSYNGLFNIYVYDKQQKRIIRKEAVPVGFNKKVTGSYEHDSSKVIVDNYIARRVTNELIRKFDEIDRALQARD